MYKACFTLKKEISLKKATETIGINYSFDKLL